MCKNLIMGPEKINERASGSQFQKFYYEKTLVANPEVGAIEPGPEPGGAMEPGP